ncbi:MAG: glycine C-acetyltransferase [Candidatus Kerfeldbacteria bacterium CG_4_10_14_0_8_um_filter_42_10]|uniref:2-amino-3-ketobutyrate coenzyme A ligase n=1 Tax=Candidatus Kerfeldbacteria bacterium CG_4_10_14_0_8_um_filter_42_10 TaxID=2014248 RepID=A0A2M7RJ10_9BACT|nr:MAG: glycine C-acetyltransferase [Candidatus Kerfeldbacteria bacterium CG_4_10_14_0_8_um_filter_42_10]
MYGSLKTIIEKELEAIKEKGLYKEERVISSYQSREITVRGKKLLNFCANNYLGLASNEKLVAAAKNALGQWGFGLSSVRFICGTQEIHKELEKKVAQFIGFEDALLYSSCFDANLGFFQTVLNEQDAVISDELNHASIIDGIRLCKAERFVYKHMDLDDLEHRLKDTKGKRLRLIATDGVFSMEGDVAPMDKICDLADKYDAQVMMDDAHGTGFMGENGRGTHEFRGVNDRIDFITSTFGKALGGASGGFTVAKKEVIEFFRQRSRNYVFSNSLAPIVTAVSAFVIDYLQEHPELRNTLWKNTRYFREKMENSGFIVPKSEHPIVPIMLGDAKLAQVMARELFEEGIYVMGFGYPVVPLGKARIRVQISAGHTKEDLDRAVESFTNVAKKKKAL